MDKAKGAILVDLKYVPGPVGARIPLRELVKMVTSDS